MHLGTGNFTFEWVARYDVATAQTTTVFWGLATNGYALVLQIDLTPNKGYFFFKATDGTTTTWQPTLTTTPLNDAVTRKHRLVASARGTAGALLTYYIDGVSQATADFSAQNGKTIENEYALFGWNQAVAWRHDGVMYEFRLSLNATNNSGGPGGG
jgi:hypothetical protein